jgi:hypothetical protein
MRQLAKALGDRKITVLYVMEIDLQNTVDTPTPLPFDNVDRDFDRFVERLRSACPEPKGFVALLRVPRCAFCIPFQKPGLFSRYASEDELAANYAFTTVEIPETSEGKGNLGTAVLPQRDRVAHAMRDYMFDLVAHVQKHAREVAADPDGELREAPFHFRSYPELEEADLVERIRPIAGL